MSDWFPTRRRSLTTLPDDILLHVLSLLEADDVLSLSSVCHKLHELSNLPVVWHRLFLNLLHRARYIDCLAIDHKPLEDVSLHELKKSIIQTTSAEKNWLCEKPRARFLAETIDLKRAIRTDISFEQSAYIVKFTSKHLLVPFEGGILSGWDLKRNTSAGSFDMEPDCMIVDLALDKPNRALVGLIAKVAPVRFDDSFGMHIRLGALRIGVPGPDSSDPLLFERSKQMTLLMPFSSEVHLLDASRRMICSAFCIHHSTDMGILLVFDWETEEAAVFNTGIPYDYGRSLIGVHLSPDGQFLVLVSESEGSEVRRWYPLANLKPSHSLWNTLENPPGQAIAPARQEIFKWAKEPAILSKASGTNGYVFWIIDQLPEPPFPEIPARISTIVLYVTVPESTESELVPSDKTWTVSQYYSDENGPCAPSRSYLTLRSPAPCPNDPVEHGMPIVCMSFNHFGWVEEVDVDGRSERQLKLATFPDPGTCFDGDLADTARTLDVPSDVLDSAYHILLDATQGMIIVATEKQTLHVYRY